MNDHINKEPALLAFKSKIKNWYGKSTSFGLVSLSFRGSFLWNTLDE